MKYEFSSIKVIKSSGRKDRDYHC